jgi:hypothetical protein
MRLGIAVVAAVLSLTACSAGSNSSGTSEDAAVTKCGTEAPAGALTADQQEFLSRTASFFSSCDFTATRLLSMGDAVCEDFAQSSSWSQAVSDAEQVARSNQATALVNISIDTLCGQYSYLGPHA